jgi:hypothetical protein
MDSTPNLSLPYIMAAQAQKHVTHNEAIRALDALLHAMVLDQDLATPPGSPADGARYIVAASPTGAWAGQAGKLAAWQDGVWLFYAPREGWLVWVADEDKIYNYDGSAWAAITVAVGSGASTWGINATADTTNRLAVKSTASLLDNVGNGHQQKINKAAAGDTASQLFQTGYSGRAEFGLTGDDDFHVKVSADGSAWNEAIVVDRTTGAVRFPNTAYVDLPAASAPATPASGKVRLYAKTDKSLYQKDDAGLETGLAGGGGGTAATQAEQEAGSSTTVFTSPGRQQYHPSAAKAWVSFNGQGTVAIRSSYNVSSITDNGTGDYTVNFTTAFSGADAYAGFGYQGGGNVTSGGFTSGPYVAAPTTSAYRLATFSAAVALADAPWVQACFFGDQ